MHAIQLEEFGPPENLRYEELPDPEPTAGQVSIEVEVAGAHFVDTVLRRGQAMGANPLPPLPMVPGREVAGTVAAVGEGVDESWVGKRVVVHLGPANGGYADRAVAPVDALHELPDGLPFADAVAMIGTGRTALAILDFAAIDAADRVLVLAAAGGLGTLLMQGAKGAGATVVGTARGADKVERLPGLGATAGVDHSSADWADTVRRAFGDQGPTMVLDSVGGSLGVAAKELLEPGGKLVMFGWSSGEPTEVTTRDLYSRSLTAGFAIGPRLAKLPGGMRGLETRALEAATKRELVPAIEEFPLADTAAAHAAIEARTTVGKVVLIPSE